MLAYNSIAVLLQEDLADVASSCCAIADTIAAAGKASASVWLLSNAIADFGRWSPAPEHAVKQLVACLVANRCRLPQHHQSEQVAACLQHHVRPESLVKYQSPQAIPMIEAPCLAG